MWEASRSTDSELTGDAVMQWDQLIEGARWYRKAPYNPNQFVYIMDMEDAAAVQAKTQIDLSNFIPPYGDWNPAHWWAERSNFPVSDIFWRAELAYQPPAQPATPPNVRDDSESEPEDNIQPVVAQAGQANIGQRLADPTITSDGAAQYAPRGAYAWTVSMTVTAPQPAKTWLIQRLHLTDHKGRITFWEAFPVQANQGQAANKDVYQANARKPSGKVSIRAVMQHHDFSGGDPPGMRVGGSDYCDSQQMASDQAPAFWLADDGTQHDLDFAWGPFGTTLTTAPASGNPVKKEAWQDLDFG